MQAQLAHGQGVIPEYQSKGIKILAQQLRPRVHVLLFSVTHDLQLTTACNPAPGNPALSSVLIPGTYT